jgi:tetratricopeptide (TPR) repeat protein
MTPPHVIALKVIGMLKKSAYASPLMVLSTAGIDKGIYALSEGKYTDAIKLFENALSYLESDYCMARKVSEKVSILDIMYDQAYALMEILHDLNIGMPVIVKTHAKEGKARAFIVSIPVSAIDDEAHRFVPELSRVVENTFIYVNDKAKNLYEGNKLSGHHREWAGDIIFASKLLHASTYCILLFNDIDEVLRSRNKTDNVGRMVSRVPKLFDSAINDMCAYKYRGYQSRLGRYITSMETIRVETIEMNLFQSLSKSYGEQLSRSDAVAAASIDKALRRTIESIEFRRKSIEEDRVDLGKSLISMEKTAATISAFGIGAGAYVLTQGDYIASTIFMLVATGLGISSLLKARATKKLLRRSIEDEE